MQLDDRAAAAFLVALGRDPSTVRLRAFPHSDTPAAVKKALGARKFSWGDAAGVEGAETAGLGIYVGINPGGDTKASIKHCIAYFAEFDDIPKDQQLAIAAAKMPPASIIIDTGGDSLHFYWVLAAPTADKVQWQEDQKRIAKHLGSDPSINDPSRVMRLPGAIYFDAQQQPAGRAAIVHEGDERYSREEVLSRIPAEQAAPPEPPSGAPAGAVTTDSTNRTIRQAAEQLSRVPARIPGTGTRHVYLKLLWALSELTGPAEAGRMFAQHSPAWAAAEDLVALAQQGSGDLKVNSFFYVVKEEWGITRSTRTTTRTRKMPTPQQPAAAPVTPSSTPSTETPAYDQARIKLKQHIADGLSGSALATKVLEIADEYDCFPSALHRMVQELQLEDDADIQADVELEGIREAARLEQERKEFTLELLLPHKCVEPLRYLSTSLQADDLAAAMIFLTTMTGTLKAGTRIWGDEISFAERPQLWLALIGKSGLGKSPAIRNLGLALAMPVAQAYQHRNVDRYQKWEVVNAGVAKNQRTPEPEPFVFQISNYTAGAIVKQFATNELERLGMLLAVDELAALFSSLNEFQDKAKGSEEEQLLSLFDNNGDHQIRVKDGYRSYSEAQLSIIGGIQPLVFDQLASRGDRNGLFARLLLLPLPTDYRGGNKPPNVSLPMTIAMQQELEAVMLRASDLPHARYSLDSAAMKQFEIIKKESFVMSDTAVLGAHGGIYGKRAGYILRMAGALHIVKVACGDVPQDALIPLPTLLLARDIISHLQQYAITAQSRAAQAAEGSITELMRWIHRYALDKQTSAGRFRADALTPKKRKQYSLQTITAYVQKLVDAGYAHWLPGRSKNGGRQFSCSGRLPG